MDPSAIDSISGRLSDLPDLYFPRSTTPSPSSPATRKSLLVSLLFLDPALFLERYGSLLTPAELLPFRPLSHNNYEVRFHLTRLENQEPRPATVKNRRRAYMEGLVMGGDYFSEEAMREREPYLHYEMVGRWQDPMGRGMARPGERWSETLMRRCEEVRILERIRGEQIRRGVDPKEWVGDSALEYREEEEQMEEVESEDEEEDEEGEDKLTSLEEEHGNEEEPSNRTAGEAFNPSLSAEEMQEQLDQFTRIMQQKFMSGEDTEHLDYSKIDNDERLDDHWHREASHDEEEKYFDED